MAKVTIGNMRSKPRSVAFEAKKYYACPCGSPTVNEFGQHLDECPKCGLPTLVEDLGTIAYYNKNPIIQLVWNISHWVKHLPLWRLKWKSSTR